MAHASSYGFTHRALPARVRVPSGVNIAWTERFLAVIGAFALTYFAASRKNKWSVPASLLSVELFRRAYTGHSYIYASLGISGRKPEGKSAMGEIERSITIRGDREEIERFLESNCLIEARFEFEELGDGKATEVHARLSTDPQDAFEADKKLRRALRDLKQIIEVGEIATIEGQPHGSGTKAFFKKSRKH